MKIKENVKTFIKSSSEEKPIQMFQKAISDCSVIVASQVKKMSIWQLVKRQRQPIEWLSQKTKNS